MTALEGMRILDMTQYEAGPSGTQALAFLGADVVKLEQPGAGDPGRTIAGQSDSAYFYNWNANKRSVALNLREPEGRELLLKMAPNFDVFVENFGPGVVEKLDLGYDVLKEVHPPIIYASVKGFGLDGPYSHYKCFDGVAQAASGAFSVTGTSDSPPMLPGTTTGDCGTGTQLALAITAAYVQRLKTGVGQRIELSMQEAMTYYMRTRIGIGSGWGTKPAPRAGDARLAELGTYACAPGGPNDYVVFMAVTPAMFASMCEVMGRPDLASDERFTDARSRSRNAEALRAEIAAWSATLEKREIMKMMGDAGVPCSAVLDTKDLHEDEHLLARNFVKKIEHPVDGEVSIMGWPARLSESEVEITAAPGLGEHSASVLRTELGLSEDEIDRLRSQGVIQVQGD